VERRQASAPVAEGGASRSLRGACRIFGAVVAKQRLPAFYFPFFYCRKRVVWLPETSLKEFWCPDEQSEIRERGCAAHLLVIASAKQSSLEMPLWIASSP
jgi:hypothetical protein